MSIEVLALSNYVRPEIKESAGQSYVLNGPKNSFFKYLIARYNGSPTNRAIIDSYAKFIYGKGLYSKQQSIKAYQFALILRMLPKKTLKALIKDYSVFESGVLELKYKNGKLFQTVHVERNMIAPSKVNDEGEITSYWYSRDFSNTNKYPAIEIPAFGFSDSKTGSKIYVFQDYQVGKIYYADPAYLAGLPYAELEEEIANYCVNHIKNGLSFGYILNFNNGEPPDEKTKKKIRDEITERLSGSSNAGKFILAWNDSKEKACTIEALQVSDAHKQYEFLSSEATQKLLISHCVVSPILFGIKDSTGLGNNAQEMESAFNELMINVIQPRKEVILDGLMEIFASEGMTIDLDFIPLRKPAAQATTLAAQTDEGKDDEGEKELDDFVANELIAVGEKIEASEWELVDEKAIEGEPELLEMTLQLAYVPSNFPERESVQDTSLFKVRYEYSGSQNPQRAFCVKMMGAGLVYRKEDIDAAGKKAVNAGFGPKGSNTYNIWLYKGGARCKHFWMRKIYIKANDKNITAAKAQEMLNELEPALRKEARIEKNDPKVAKYPNDMPNNGFLTPKK